MDIKTAEAIAHEKLLDNIDNYLEYREAGIYHGEKRCLEYIQHLVGCEEDIAKQIFDNHQDVLAVPDETPEQYEARHRAVEAEVLRSQNKPKCPICQSTNLSKISTATKAMKIAAFGIFGMGDNGKTWKCNNCGSRF